MGQIFFQKYAFLSEESVCSFTQALTPCCRCWCPAFPHRHFASWIFSRNSRTVQVCPRPVLELLWCHPRRPGKGLPLILPDLLFISFHRVSVQVEVPLGCPRYQQCHGICLRIWKFILVQPGGKQGYDNTLISVWFWRYSRVGNWWKSFHWCRLGQNPCGWDDLILYWCLLQKGIKEWLWITMRIGNAGSGLDGGLALRCQNSGESKLLCLTLPWQRDTNQGFRRVKEAAVSVSCFPEELPWRFPMFCGSAASALVPLCTPLPGSPCWHRPLCPCSEGVTGVPQPLLVLSPGAQLLVSPVLEQGWSRAWKWISWLLALPVRPKHH